MSVLVFRCCTTSIYLCVVRYLTIRWVCVWSKIQCCRAQCAPFFVECSIKCSILMGCSMSICVMSTIVFGQQQQQQKWERKKENSRNICRTKPPTDFRLLICSLRPEVFTFSHKMFRFFVYISLFICSSSLFFFFFAFHTSFFSCCGWCCSPRNAASSREPTVATI